MLDKSKIGCATEERVIEVEASMVRLFCQAIGETSPIYLDLGAAKSAGYRGILAPPTYAACLQNLIPSVQDLLLDVLGLDIGRLLHGEHSFSYKQPICVGDTIRISQRIVDIYDKKGGALEFIVVETLYINQFDEICVTDRATIVLRN